MTAQDTAALAARFASAHGVRLNCPTCAADDSLPLLVGDRHALGLVFVHCNACGLVYLSPSPDAAWFADFYKDYYWRYYLTGDLADQFRVAVGRAGELLAAVLPALPRPPVSFLDVGCGPGGLLSVLQARPDTAFVCGTEPSEESRRWCGRQGIGPVYGTLDEVVDAGLRFDLITICHVLEHTPAPVRELATLRDLLTPEGRLYVEVPDIRSTTWSGIGFFHIAHILNFDAGSLRRTLALAGLSVEKAFHGIVTDWPWAVGMLARRSDGPDEAAAAPDFSSLARHVGQAVKRQPRAAADHDRESRRATTASAGLSRLRRAVSRTFRFRPRGAPAHHESVARLEAENADLSRTNARLRHLLDACTAQPHEAWLYRHRAERMDIASAIFDTGRRLFHGYRYRFATAFCRGLRVADIACGTGYGTKMLAAAGATSTVGIDIDPETVAYARQVYGGDGIEYLHAAGDASGLPTASRDLVVSFETIEHVPDDQSLLAEFFRLLTPGGRLIVSTPNDWPVDASPHHVRTYDRAAFERVLSRHFVVEGMYNQNSGGDSPFNHGQPAGIVPTTSANDGLAECLIAVARKPT